MDTCSLHLFFFPLLLLLSVKATANGSFINATEKDLVAGVVGAIVDQDSRLGKEEKIAMEMAIKDFYEKTNQRFHLHIVNSQNDPVQAAFAGECDMIKLLSFTNNLSFRLLLIEI